jgi:hypothetical protein
VELSACCARWCAGKADECRSIAITHRKGREERKAKEEKSLRSLRLIDLHGIPTAQGNKAIGVFQTGFTGSTGCVLSFDPVMWSKMEKPQINADERRYLRDFSLFSRRSGKPLSTQRDAEKNNNPLRSSASSAVNHNHSSFHGGMHMTVTITALRDQLYFPDTDLQGLTQINGFNNSINIFQPVHPTRNHKTHFSEVLT